MDADRRALDPIAVALTLMIAVAAAIASAYVFFFREIHHPITVAFASAIAIAAVYFGRSVIARALERIPARWALALFFLVAFALRVLWIFAADTVPESDFKAYLDLGKTLADTGVYGAGAIPSARRPPGLPAMLALFDLVGLDPIRSGQLLNAIASALVVVPIHRWGRALGDEASGRFGALVWALMPSTIFMTSVLATEPMFALFVTAGAVLLLERRWILAGIVFGLATYARSQSVIVPIAIGVVAVLRAPREERKRVSLGHALAVLVTIALLVPWGIRNAVSLGSFTLLTKGGGVSAYIGNNPNADGRHLDPEAWPERIDREDESAQDRIGYTKAFDFIAHHPLAFVALIPRKWIHLFKSEHDSVFWSHTNARLRAHAPRSHSLAQSYYVVVLVLATIGSARLRRRDSALRSDDHSASNAIRVGPAIDAAFAIVSAWYAQHAFYHAQPRYHAALTPIFCILAALIVAQDPARSRIR
jgi:4-amino-4-deoxy-L-arabinose transferase-like glycosyltransferase